ncbi:hypothetical protein HDU87_002674 [Geranomyces variabilis]|uniref:Hikeshi-like domain-containing protein n=1 Tax=Geranomyces variabilis TaxID=109894 RepID=A0AAD5TRD6_9FUNG|nr:hypothetical protein HDU87_002674 [Geranomyces variabilis]
MVQVDATKYVFDLEDPESINHIVAFMTGIQAFPPGFAATVHFLWPSNPTWQFLGILSNDKPSAIYRLGGNKKATQSNTSSLSSSSMMMDDTLLMTPGARELTPAKLGISVETIEAVMAQAGQHGSGAGSSTGTSTTTASTAGALVKNIDPVLLTTKILESLYNYCSSFAGPLPALGSALFGGMDWGSTFIPLKALQDWFGVMQRKLKADPSGGSILRTD